jgi:hypothetical protein
VKAFGRCFRVPRAGLEQMLGGELRWTREPKAAPVVEAAVALEAENDPATKRRSSRRQRSRDDSQLSLFDLPTSATPDTRA